MTEKREMKEISLETLNQVEKKASLSKYKKAAGVVVIVLVLAGGAFGAHRILSGQIMASRFIVNKMVCPACIVTVKEVTGKIPGVLEADVSLASQDVVVKFRDKKTNAEAIESAIAGAGYPVKLEGTFTPPSQGLDEVVIASVNGQPLLSKDTELPVDPTPGQATKSDPASAFFSIAGKEILLQVADQKQVIVQPYEVGEQVQAYMKEKGLTIEEMKAWSEKTYGSNEKYFQVVAQRIGIRKLLDEHILDGVKDPAEKKRKTMEWIGKVFKDADVKVLKPDYKQKLLASVGQAEWKVFWPLMIGKDTELKRLLVN